MGKKKEQYCPLTRWQYFTKTLYHDPSSTGEFTYDGVVYRKSATYFRSAMPLAAGILLIVAGQALRLSRLPKDILSHLTDTGRREL